MDMIIIDFQLIKVFRVAIGILKSTKTMFLLRVAQVIVEAINFEDSYELATLQAKLADKAVISCAEP